MEWIHGERPGDLQVMAYSPLCSVEDQIEAKLRLEALVCCDGFSCCDTGVACMWEGGHQISGDKYVYS